MIQRLLLLFTISTSIGCADPIIGEWNANEVCDGGTCYALPSNQDGIKYSVNMSINEDLTGSMSSTMIEDTKTEIETVNINVSIEDETRYELSRINDDGTIDKIMCEMKNEELECFDEEFDINEESITFEKAE